jgi:hypothetical protein
LLVATTLPEAAALEAAALEAGLEAEAPPVEGVAEDPLVVAVFSDIYISF